MRIVSLVGKLALGLLVLLIAANLGGYVYERMAEARDAKLYPPPGRLCSAPIERFLCRP